MIPYGRQEITVSDIESVTAVLKSDFLTQGPVVPRFEQAIANKVKVKHAVAVNSATSALHIACLALELGLGDRLWTSPNTFVASANCGLYCDAIIDFVDIDQYTYNLDVNALEVKLKKAEKNNTLPKVVVAVHFSGQSCDMKKIYLLSQRYNFKIIEDASHAIGGKYFNEYIGSCAYSDITVFSFHPVKIITTGEGGMAVTNNNRLDTTMKMLRSHGITREVDKFYKESNDPWYYEQQILGYNYRMTDIQAALGLNQYERLDTYITKRNTLAEVYNSKLVDLPLRLPTISKENKSAFHLYVVRLKCDELSKTHKQIFNEIREQGIGVNLHYLPVHLQPFYRERGFTEGQYPVAEAYSKEAISLPLYPQLTELDQNRVIDVLHQILESSE